MDIQLLLNNLFDRRFSHKTGSKPDKPGGFGNWGLPRLRGPAWISLLLLTACTNPLIRLAEKEHLHAVVVTGSPFQHQLFSKQSEPDSVDPVHIYLDGDGRPWRTPNQLSLDPTPANPLVLKLLLQDRAPAIYLGRPCYFVSTDPHCEPLWWTMQRYAADVITSMNTVIDQQIKAGQKLVLIGYSGGGSLAMLIAQQREDVLAVVTIAANLDTERWNEHHNYSQLSGSLNPADQPALPSQVKQLHLFAGKDRNTPSFLAERTLEKQTNSEVKIYPDFDHACCWPSIWPDILQQLAIITGTQNAD